MQEMHLPRSRLTRQRQRLELSIYSTDLRHILHGRFEVRSVNTSRRTSSPFSLCVTLVLDAHGQKNADQVPSLWSFTH